MKKFLPILILSIILFSCKKITEQTEVENAEQLRIAVVRAVAGKMLKGDTLFLVSERMLGVCGNDDRFDGITTGKEKLDEMKYIRVNPYFVDARKFQEKYDFDGKTVIVGSAIGSEFSSKTQHFNNDSLKVKKPVFDIQFLKVKQDTALVQIKNYYDNSALFLNLKMVKNGSDWKSE